MSQHWSQPLLRSGYFLLDRWSIAPFRLGGKPDLHEKTVWTKSKYLAKYFRAVFFYSFLGRAWHADMCLPCAIFTFNHPPHQFNCFLLHSGAQGCLRAHMYTYPSCKQTKAGCTPDKNITFHNISPPDALFRRWHDIALKSDVAFRLIPEVSSGFSSSLLSRWYIARA